MRYCKKCNNELADKDKFCRHCGTPVNVQDTDYSEDKGQEQEENSEEEKTEKEQVKEEQAEEELPKVIIDESVEIIPNIKIQGPNEELPNIQIDEQLTSFNQNNVYFGDSNNNVTMKDQENPTYPSGDITYVNQGNATTNSMNYMNYVNQGNATNNNQGYSANPINNINTYNQAQPLQAVNNKNNSNKKNTKNINKKRMIFVGVAVVAVIVLLCCIPLFFKGGSSSKELFVYIKDTDLKVCSDNGSERKIVVKNYTDQLFHEDYNDYSSDDEDTVEAFFKATSSFDGTNLYFLKNIDASSDVDFTADLMYCNVRGNKKVKKIDTITWFGNPYHSKYIFNVNDYIDDIQPYVYTKNNTVYYQKEFAFITATNGKKEKLLDDIYSFTRIDDSNIKITKTDQSVGVYKVGDKQLNIIYNADRADAQIRFINSDCSIIYYSYNDILYRYKDNKVNEIRLQSPLAECFGINYMDDGSFYYLVENQKSVDMKQYITDNLLEQDNKVKEPKEEDYIKTATDDVSYNNIISYYNDLKDRYNDYLSDQEDYYTDYSDLEDFILSEETYTYYYDYIYSYSGTGTFDDYIKECCTSEEMDYDAWNKAQDEYYPVSERNSIRNNINEYISDFQYTTYDLYYVDDQGEKKVAEDINNFTTCDPNVVITNTPSKMHSIAYYKLPSNLETILDIKDIEDVYYGALDEVEYDIYKKLCLNGQIYVAIDGIEKELDLGKGNNYIMQLGPKADSLYITYVDNMDSSIPYQNSRETYYTYYDQLDQNTSQLEANAMYKIDLTKDSFTPIKIGNDIDYCCYGKDGMCYYYKDNGSYETGDFYADNKLIQKDFEQGIVRKIDLDHGKEMIVLGQQFEDDYTIYILKNDKIIDTITDVKSVYAKEMEQFFYITTDYELYSWDKGKSKRLDKSVVGACISEDMNQTELLYERYDE